MTMLAPCSDDLQAAVPLNFRLSGPRRIETGVEVNPFERPGRVVNPSVPVWQVSAKGCSLRARRPVGVRIRSEGGFYFAENDGLVVSGSGLTAGEALQDFFGQIVHFYRYYRNLRDDQVIGEAAGLKQLFAEVFEEQDRDAG